MGKPEKFGSVSIAVFVPLRMNRVPFRTLALGAVPPDSDTNGWVGSLAISLPEPRAPLLLPMATSPPWRFSVPFETLSRGPARVRVDGVVPDGPPSPPTIASVLKNPDGFV